MFRCLLFVNVTATTYIYTYVHTLSLNDALPILVLLGAQDLPRIADGALDFVINIASFQEMSREQVSAYLDVIDRKASGLLYTQQLWSSRSEEHTSELQSLMRISYAVFCLKKKKKRKDTNQNKETCNTEQ